MGYLDAATTVAARWSMFFRLRLRRKPAGRGPADFRALQRAGAVAITDDGKPILNDGVMRDTLRVAAELNRPVIQHADDTRATEGCSMNEARQSFRLGLRGMKSSTGSVDRGPDIDLAKQFSGARLHISARPPPTLFRPCASVNEIKSA